MPSDKKKKAKGKDEAGRPGEPRRDRTQGQRQQAEQQIGRAVGTQLGVGGAGAQQAAPADDRWPWEKYLPYFLGGRDAPTGPGPAPGHAPGGDEESSTAESEDQGEGAGSEAPEVQRRRLLGEAKALLEQLTNKGDHVKAQAAQAGLRLAEGDYQAVMAIFLKKATTGGASIAKLRTLMTEIGQAPAKEQLTAIEEGQLKLYATDVEGCFAEAQALIQDRERAVLEEKIEQLRDRLEKKDDALKGARVVLTDREQQEALAPFARKAQSGGASPKRLNALLGSLGQAAESAAILWIKAALDRYTSDVDGCFAEAREYLQGVPAARKQAQEDEKRASAAAAQVEQQRKQRHEDMKRREQEERDEEEAQERERAEQAKQAAAEKKRQKQQEKQDKAQLAADAQAREQRLAVCLQNPSRWPVEECFQEGSLRLGNATRHYETSYERHDAWAVEYEIAGAPDWVIHAHVSKAGVVIKAVSVKLKAAPRGTPLLSTSLLEGTGLEEELKKQMAAHPTYSPNNIYRLWNAGLLHLPHG